MTDSVLVFGSGFVGAAVTAVLERDVEVTVLDLPEYPILAERNDEARALVLNTLTRTGARAVVNTSGLLRGTDEVMNSANVAWPAWLVDDVLGATGVRFVHLGSAAEYGDPGSAEPVRETAHVNPNGVYGETKWAGTAAVLAARAAGLDAVVARGFNLVGPNLAPVSPLFQFLTDVTAAPDRGGSVEIWWPETLRDFITLDDMAAAIASLALADEVPDIVNLCAQVGITFAEIVHAMATHQGKSVEIVSADRPGIPAVVGDNSRLIEITGIRPQMSAEIIATGAGF